MFRTRFAQAVLILHAVGFGLVAVTGLRDPQVLMAPADISIAGVSGYSEIRAVYGGVNLLLTVLFLAAAISKRLRSTGLLVLVLFLGGLVLGRCVSLAVDGVPGNFVLRLFTVEVIGAIAAVAALVLHRGRPRPSLHAGDL